MPLRLDYFPIRLTSSNIAFSAAPVARHTRLGGEPGIGFAALTESDVSESNVNVMLGTVTIPANVDTRLSGAEKTYRALTRTRAWFLLIARTVMFILPLRVASLFSTKKLT